MGAFWLRCPASNYVVACISVDDLKCNSTRLYRTQLHKYRKTVDEKTFGYILACKFCATGLKTGSASFKSLEFGVAPWPLYYIGIISRRFDRLDFSPTTVFSPPFLRRNTNVEVSKSDLLFLDSSRDDGDGRLGAGNYVASYRSRPGQEWRGCVRSNCDADQ